MFTIVQKLQEPVYCQQYEESEYLITQTIYRQFPNHQFFAKAHGLDFEDLKQFGGIGLMKAIETYDDSKGCAFNTYAINTIRHYINKLAKKYSLNNINSANYDLANKVSMNTITSDGDGNETTLENTISSPSNYMDELEIRIAVDRLKGSIPDQAISVVRLRLDGYTYAEIGEMLNISAARANKIIMENKENLFDMLIAK